MAFATHGTSTKVGVSIRAQCVFQPNTRHINARMQQGQTFIIMSEKSSNTHGDVLLAIQHVTWEHVAKVYIVTWNARN